MSNDWIRKVAGEIAKSDPDLASDIISAMDMGRLIRTVSAVKRTTPGRGSIVSIRVEG